jgi:hypothetical protein
MQPGLSQRSGASTSSVIRSGQKWHHFRVHNSYNCPEWLRVRLKGDRPRPRRSATPRTSFSPGHAALAPARSPGRTPGRAGRGRSAPSRRSQCRAARPARRWPRRAEEELVIEVLEYRNDGRPPVRGGPAGQAGHRALPRLGADVIQVADVDHPVSHATPHAGLGEVCVLPGADPADLRVLERGEHVGDHPRLPGSGRECPGPRGKTGPRPMSSPHTRPAPPGKNETTKTAPSIPSRRRPPRGQSAPSGGADATTTGPRDGAAPRQSGEGRLSSCRLLSATPVAAGPPAQVAKLVQAVPSQF